MKKGFSGKDEEKKTPEKTVEEETAKVEDDVQETEVVKRKKDKENVSKVDKGCFVRNIMHKGKIFKIGHKLGTNHADYGLLKKHLA